MQSTKGAASCTDCPEGYSRDMGENACHRCGTGTQRDPVTHACTRCLEGMVREQDWMVKCVACEAGKWAYQSTRCYNCPVDYYSKSALSLSCTKCPLSYGQERVGQTECIACSPGKIRGSEDSGCTVCRVGTYSPLKGTECKDCAVGKFASATGTSECSDCPLGYIADSNGARECVACPAGKLRSDVKATACRDCSASTYMSRTGASVCDYCPAGWSAATAGLVACVAATCKAGTIAMDDISRPGSVICGCAAGSYGRIANLADNAIQICKSCPMPFANGPLYTDRSNATIACTIDLTRSGCPAGTYLQSMTSRGCWLCPASTTSPANSIGFDSCV